GSGAASARHPPVHRRTWRRSAECQAVAVLFRQHTGGLRFEGEMVYKAHHLEQAPDRTGAPRSAIVFEFRPLQAIQDHLEQARSVQQPSLDELRKLALQASLAAPGTPSVSRTVFERSRDVRNYVLARACGRCEGCGAVAPFKRADGTPYLEPHHIRRLTDGGPDDPQFVIALCPNCHRRGGSRRGARHSRTRDDLTRRNTR